MTAVAHTKNGLQQLQLDPSDGFEDNLEQASEICNSNDNVNFIVVQK